MNKFQSWLAFSFLVLTVSTLASAQSEPPYISRYYGRSFNANGYTLCQDELASVLLRLKQNKLDVVSSQCVQGSLGYWSVAVDYAHPFSKSIESFKKDIPLSGDYTYECKNVLPAVTKSFELAELAVISLGCNKSTTQNQVQIDYITNNKRAIDDFESPVSTDTKDACELDLKAANEAFTGMGSVVLVGYCQAFTYGLSKQLFYRPELVHAIQLGKSIENMNGAETTDLAACKLSAQAVAKRFDNAGFKTLIAQCARVGDKLPALYREYVAYVDALLPRVRTYSGVGAPSLDGCLTATKNAGDVYEKSKRVVLHSFCRLSQGFGSPAQYLPTLYYVEPKIVIPPPKPTDLLF